MSSYFVRYTSNPEADLNRGFSFVGYMLFSTKESALENIADLSGAAYETEDFDFAAWAEDNEHLVGQDNVTDKWGQIRSGLCGYGPFDSVEAAKMAIENGDCAGGTVTISSGAIFEGNQTLDYSIDGQDEGVTFRPVAIVATF